MAIKIGHARHDENGKLKNGKLGDNNGQEVAITNFYMHQKGWYAFSLKDVDQANKLAQAMTDACKNNMIGYDQTNRNGVIKMLEKYGSLKAIKEKTESDCSSLVRACLIQATGKDLGAFRTANQVEVFEKSGLFEKKHVVKSSADVYNGDVIVTKTKGHTAIVVSGRARKKETSNTTKPTEKVEMKLIALDAGHGLNTPGKRTPDGIHEWELNDKVRDYVVKYLDGYNCKFIFPDNNEGKTDETLTKRRTMYVNAKADACVSIHHNALSGKWGTATGVEIFTDRNCTAADTELAKAIYKNLPKYTGLRGRGVKKENWTVIYQNKVPAVLVEGGFMDTKKDHAIITSTAGQKAYAKAVAEGLIDFLDLKKVSSGNTSSENTSNTSNNSNTSNEFKVKLKSNMNVRKNAGTNYAKVTTAKKNYVYTITKTKDVKGSSWGKLKSGAGWICIDDKYCTRV